MMKSGTEWCCYGKFSGPLMDQLIQESQMAQVLWVKDENNSTEVMEGSYRYTGRVQRRFAC